MSRKQKVLVIVGSTSSGKSALAVRLAKKFNGEVISADSRQVYKGLDIGTGKITAREMQGVLHHLLDVVLPKKIFTVQQYVERARAKIATISQIRKLPIVVGGTGFYIDVLLGRVALPNVPPNPELRANLEQKTAGQLLALLEARDPRRAATVDPHNKRRLIRALEIIRAVGRVPCPQPAPRYDALWIGLALPKRELEKRIATRLRVRLRKGMIEEARRLHREGLSYKRMKELGLEYRALARHLQGKVSRTKMIDELKHDIRRYAKRQLTYWRRNKQIHWFEPARVKAIESLVQKHCK